MTELSFGGSYLGRSSNTLTKLQPSDPLIFNIRSASNPVGLDLERCLLSSEIWKKAIDLAIAMYDCLNLKLSVLLKNETTTISEASTKYKIILKSIFSILCLSFHQSLVVFFFVSSHPVSDCHCDSRSHFGIIPWGVAASGNKPAESIRDGIRVCCSIYTHDGSMVLVYMLT